MNCFFPIRAICGNAAKGVRNHTTSPWLLLLSFVTLAGSPARAYSAADIVPHGAELEQLFDGACTLSEGVAVAPDGMVYFSDITFTFVCRDEAGFREAGNIWRFDPKTGEATIFRSPSGMSNGIKFDARGDMIVAEGATATPSLSVQAPSNR